MTMPPVSSERYLPPDTSAVVTVEKPKIDESLITPVVPVDLAGDRIIVENKRTGLRQTAPAITGIVRDILDAGGLVPYLRRGQRFSA